MPLLEHTAEFPGSGHPPITISIYPKVPAAGGQDSLIVIDRSLKYVAGEEADIQLLESCEYEFELSSPGYLVTTSYESDRIIIPSRIKRGKLSGTLRPGLFVGCLDLLLLDNQKNVISSLPVEIRSVKLSYRNDFRNMLDFIMEKSLGLLLQIRSPATGMLTPDPGRTAETIAQRFAFLRSLIGSREFQDSITRIAVLPHSHLECREIKVPVSRSFRGTKRTAKELARGSQRLQLPKEHPLTEILDTAPVSIVIHRKKTTIDTPENRFVKFALRSFLTFLNRMKNRLEQIGEKTTSALYHDVEALEENLEAILYRPFFKEISDPSILSLGSPVLQQKGGYRELLRAWLYFDLAARLSWSGGEDAFKAGRRDIAMLYEYWVFFKLLDIMGQTFDLETPPAQELVTETPDGFELRLKAGEYTVINAICERFGRRLNVRFCYNRTFSRHGSDGMTNYPKAGSWSERMRPDYTLTLWPEPFTELQAENQELIVHIHFDAKYRVDNLADLFGESDSELVAKIDEQMTLEKKAQREGTYKRADLLKMHAYRDAIRRTAGAYVIYPGYHKRVWRGFHEILPGLGAFPLRPVAKGDDGSHELEEFINQVVEHICDRATRREQESYHRWKINENSSPYPVKGWMPEYIQTPEERHSPPQDTYVLIGFYKDARHLDWIRISGHYELGIGGLEGLVSLNPNMAGARYLLLRSEDMKCRNGLMLINSNGPQIFSKQELINIGYPHEPQSNFYFVFSVNDAPAFGIYSWDLNLLGDKIPDLSNANLTIALDTLLSIAASR
ncbi:MAG: DUF2357 domain-containing protein [Thermodesulfobacteriota bacterium]|nr:MAG: DUF2357 domain-containing protein [Thermodesulfobacteriota bacterium]